MANKRKKTKRRFRLNPKLRFVVFISAFAVIGGLVYVLVTHANPYFSGPTSTCSMSQLSDSVVLPGTTVTAKITVKNTSTDGSYFDSTSYGAHILELNPGYANDGFTSYWNPNRFYPYMHMAPNETATFSIAAKAPSTAGTYPFGWAVGVGNLGAVAYGCSGAKIKVINQPTVTLTANGQSQNITVTKGAALTLAWSPSSAEGCSASGSWSGSKSTTSSSENRTVDTSVAGQRTYTITCSNSLPANVSASRTVTVNEPSVVVPPTTTSGGPSTPKTTNTIPKATPVPSATPDKTPPATPTNFSATYSDSVISLSWSDASDDTGVKNYSLERTRDNTNWELLSGEGLTSTSYDDTSVAFNTTYQYRLRAFDFASNASGYATVSAQAGSFEPNAKPDQEFSITSEDGLVTVTLPAGALTQEAVCDLRTSDFLPPTLDRYESIAGPYELLCKTVDGSKVTSFASAPTAKVTAVSKKYAGIKMYGRGTEDWKELQAGSEPHTFVLGDSTALALMGQLKKTPLWMTLLKIVLILAAIIGGGIAGLRMFYKARYRGSLQNKARDYYNKEHGY